MKMNPLQYAEARKQTYECPVCCRIAPWTDGRSVQAGDERDEFWCQTCGTETPLEAMTVADNVIYGDGADPARPSPLKPGPFSAGSSFGIIIPDSEMVTAGPVLSAAGAAEVVLRATGLEAGWRRAGSRCYSYHGTLSDENGVVWTCAHRHGTKPDAVRCAAERVQQVLADCIAALKMGGA